MSEAAESLTALVVDDDATSRFLIKVALRRFGCKVVEAELGVDGLQQVRDVRPDLMVLDVLMPHMDGLDVLRYLRSDPEFGSLPVIVVSVLGEDHPLVSQLYELGISRYFTKPLDRDAISKQLAVLIAQLQTGK